MTFAAAAVLTCTWSTLAHSQQISGERLKFVLVLTRLVVRSPTWTNVRLTGSAHGKALMTQFGAYYRASFAQDGLMLANGCSGADRSRARHVTGARSGVWH